MIIREFDNLDHEGKLDATWDHGVRIGYREDEEHRIILYQVSSFYIEFYFSKVKNKLVRIESFEDTDRLAPYTALINIPSPTG